MYKKVLLLTLIGILALGCVKTEILYRVQESITACDTWTSDDCEVVAVLTIIPKYTGSEYQFLGIRIQNIIQKVDTKRYVSAISEPENGDLFLVTPEEFQAALERMNALERTDDPIQFALSAKGCEISWKMFDEIYNKYCEDNR